LPIYGAKFPGFVTLAIVDTFTGNSENILLEPGKTSKDDHQRFEIHVKNIEVDAENPGVAWVALEIYYKPSTMDVPICIQHGRLCTNQIYRFENPRYIIGFDISYYIDEDDDLLDINLA
jgi:hypothetical protein